MLGIALPSETTKDLRIDFCTVNKSNLFVSDSIHQLGDELGMTHVKGVINAVKWCRQKSYLKDKSLDNLTRIQFYPDHLALQTTLARGNRIRAM